MPDLVWLPPPVSALTRLLGQNVDGQLIGLAVEVCDQGVFEQPVVGGGSEKQGHAGPEFEMVGMAEDLFSTAPVHIKNKLCTFSEPGA